jgi:hypothetical protein
MTQKQNSSLERLIADEPQGDLGQGNKTWAPDPGEQGISNRPDDDVRVVPESEEAEDAAAFGDEEDDDEDFDEDEEADEEEEDDETDA